MIDYVIKGIREEDLMTLRWNANIHIMGEKMGIKYRVRNSNGTLIGEMEKGTKDEKYKITFYNEAIKENYQDISRITKVVEQLAKRQLKNPVIENKIVYFSPHQRNYHLRYAA